jgi:hypothetical protein
MGQLSFFMTKTGLDATGLGRWSWVWIGGGGKTTRVITAYQINPRWLTKGETFWDKHTRYFEARGEIQSACAMFCVDLVSLLWQWKHSGNIIVLLGDFNKKVYSRGIATALASDQLGMHEQCQQVTGIPLPHTHNQGAIPIDGVYSTAGIDGVAVALLPSRIGVGDHRVFMVDITFLSMMGNVFPWVLPAAGCLLNCTTDRIKYNYIWVLNQLTVRHRLFKKLYTIDHDSNYVSVAEVHLWINKVDIKLEQFMKALEKDCHKYKRNDIEWPPYSGVWLCNDGSSYGFRAICQARQGTQGFCSWNAGEGLD